MEIDNYRFYSATRTETIQGKRVEKLMTIHKVTGEVSWFSKEEIGKLKGETSETKNSLPVR